MEKETAAVHVGAEHMFSERKKESESGSSPKIMLGISGGVDSTTAALLLLKQGFEVYGLYFNIHEKGEGERGAALLAMTEAYRACGLSGESAEEHFLYRNASELFREIVISDFCREYRAGRTPNPCVLCNPTVKFQLLLEEADRVGAEFLATGHYAEIQHDPARNVYYAAASQNPKDQSYMLYRLPQRVLSRLILPLSKFSNKEATREIASENHMSNAGRADSQEICFLPPNTSYIEYISACDGQASDTPGDFVDRDGKILGRHKGLIHYTIGQRKGLGIALGKPAFVTAMDSVRNTVTLGENDDLFRDHADISDLFFTETGDATLPPVLNESTLTAKVRYAAPRTPVRITEIKTENGEPALAVRFSTPQRAITPGQSLVLYEGERVLGGGRILR